MTQRPAIKALLIDLSGTVHTATRPIADSPDAIRRLRASSLPFRFCSNTSKESTASLRNKLAKMGIETRDDEVWTSLSAVNALLRTKGLARPFVLASESAEEECLRGIRAGPSPSPSPSPSLAPAPLPYDSVVVAFAPEQFDYAALNIAFRVLMGEHHHHTQRGLPPAPASAPPRSDCPLIATHRSRYLGDSDGALSLGPGPFVAALENATGKTAETVGKPKRAFFEMVLSSFGPEVREDQEEEGLVAVIGDDVQNDLGDGAVELGFWRVLVRTGKYRDGDERKEGIKPPDEVCDSFDAFVESLLDK